MKTLKRRTLIREYDFHRIKHRALTLYDRVNFKPVTCTEIEREYIINILKGKYQPHPELKSTARYLDSIKHKLYDMKYAEWISYQDNDLIYIKSRSNSQSSCLGWVVFEKDFN